MSELRGWVQAIVRLPGINDVDDAGHVYQCVKTKNGFRFLNDCHFALLAMDADRGHLDETSIGIRSRKHRNCHKLRNSHEQIT